MPKNLVVRSLSSRNTACFEDEPEGGHFLRWRFGCGMQGFLQLIKSILQPKVPLSAVDFPVGVGPFAHTRMLPRFDAYSLVDSIGIVDLLVVDSAVSDHGFYQGMAKAGPIGSARFCNKGCIAVIGGTADF